MLAGTDGYYTVSEAAKLLGVNESTVRRNFDIVTVEGSQHLRRGRGRPATQFIKAADVDQERAALLERLDAEPEPDELLELRRQRSLLEAETAWMAEATRHLEEAIAAQQRALEFLQQSRS